MSKLKKSHLEYLQESLNDIEFGSVVITVHDGRITQIDTTEKRRFSKTEKQYARTIK